MFVYRLLCKNNMSVSQAGLLASIQTDNLGPAAFSQACETGEREELLQVCTVLDQDRAQAILCSI